MAGHSKFKNIMHRKGAQDKKRAKIFSRLGREISVAVKVGGIDPESNIRLRSAINAAKSLNMPKDNIDRAIKKGEGNDPDSNYEEVRYEGYGPGGVAILMEVMTDNKNRTVPDIRHIMSKNGGNLGESGCVNWMFEKKGTITLLKVGIDEDAVLEKSLELGADDFELENDIIEITTSPEAFGEVSIGLENAGFEIEGAVGLTPVNSVNVSGNDAKQLFQLLEKLEDHEDIQKVYSNFILDESEMDFHL